MQTTENPYLQWYPGALALARNLLRCHASAEDALRAALLELEQDAENGRTAQNAIAANALSATSSPGGTHE